MTFDSMSRSKYLKYVYKACNYNADIIKWFTFGAMIVYGVLLIRPWRKIKVKKVSYFAVFNVSADICDRPIQVFVCCCFGLLFHICCLQSFFVVVLVDYSSFCSSVGLRLALGGRNSVT